MGALTMLCESVSEQLHVPLLQAEKLLGCWFLNTHTWFRACHIRTEQAWYFGLLCYLKFFLSNSDEIKTRLNHRMACFTQQRANSSGINGIWHTRHCSMNFWNVWCYFTWRTPEKSAFTGPSVNCGVTLLFTLTWGIQTEQHLDHQYVT